LTNDAEATPENTSPVLIWNGFPQNYKQAGMPQRAYSVELNIEILNIVD
jgi:hypothetical protein